jgi:ATP-binding cassette, subfamily B (MDR/TAP), member 1
MTILLGSLTNLFGGYVSPGTPSLTPPPSEAEFNSQVSKFALDLLYIGIAVLVSTYIATTCWIFAGERISRRIRGEYLRAVLRQNVAFFDRLGAGEVTNRISHDVDLIQDGISDKVARHPPER